MCDMCKKCGIDVAVQNGFCLECFSEEWGKIVDVSPMASPRILLKESLDGK